MPSLHVLTGLFIGLGLAIAGFFVSQTTLNERTGVNTATVKGLSERIVPADRAVWRLSFSVSGRGADQVGLDFERAETHRARIVEMLAEAGLEAEASFAPLVKYDQVERDYQGAVIDRYHTVSGEITVASADPAKIEPARGPVLALAREGIEVREDFIRYLFTGLNAVKPDMLAEATRNARIAANEFAADAGVAVGGIQTARQGGFQVLAANEGDDEAASIEKLLRVVTTITFYLNN